MIDLLLFMCMCVCVDACHVCAGADRRLKWAFDSWSYSPDDRKLPNMNASNTQDPNSSTREGQGGPLTAMPSIQS